MKTFRLFGLTLMAILLSVNLTSCSDDDENPIDNPEALIGEWFLIHERYWGENEDGKYDEEYSYDINNPEEDCMKWYIEEGSGKNEFIINEQYYHNNKWGQDEIIEIRLDGNKVIMPSDYDDDDVVSDNMTYELKGNKLTIKMKVVYTDGTENNAENVFQKM